MRELVVVTNRKLCQGDFLERIHLLCEAGVDKIILREKDLDEWDYGELAKDVLEVCKDYPVQCFLHQFVHLAEKLPSDGIHVSVPAAMRHHMMIRKFPVVGVSTHSLEQVEAARECQADYVFFGHVFDTDCKPGLKSRGIKALKEICENAPMPVYAIGGISPANAVSCLSAGAKGVCVMSWGMTASLEEISALGKVCHEYSEH